MSQERKAEIVPTPYLTATKPHEGLNVILNLGVTGETDVEVFKKNLGSDYGLLVEGREIDLVPVNDVGLRHMRKGDDGMLRDITPHEEIWSTLYVPVEKINNQ